MTAISKKSEFVTTREVAATLGLSLTTVQLWVEAGKLPAWKTKGGHRRIPRHAVETLQAEQHAAALDEPRRTPVVLVVEDDAVQMRLYEQKFAQWQLPVELVTATDGFDGLIKIGRHAPELVITDLAMPGMDGFQMIRKLAGASPLAGNIVVVTALGAQEIDAAGGLPAHIPVYPKPIPFVALKAMLSRRFQRISRS